MQLSNCSVTLLNGSGSIADKAIKLVMCDMQYCVKICIGMGSGSERNSQVLDIACLAMVEMIKIITC